MSATRRRKKDGFVEIYSTGRYFTVTGNSYGYESAIAPRTAELQRIHDIYLLPESAAPTSNFRAAGTKDINPVPPVVTLGAALRCFLRIGLERDKTFAELWAGARRNGNESADDQALVNKLAYWCNADPDAMIRAFLSSPYYAGKDDAHTKKCQRSDYLPNTAKNACATVYSTAAADYERWIGSRRRERNCAR